MRTAWKVFSKGSGEKLYSATVVKKALIRYKRGKKNYAPKWLREKGYHPLVFRRMKESLFFSKILCGVVVEKVEVGKKVPLPLICSYPDLGDGEIVPTHLDRWPQGTMMVEWVRPFEKKNEDTSHT